VTSHCLGTGTFGTVHLALDKIERRQVACKSVRVKNEKETIAVMKEFNTVIGLHHVRFGESCVRYLADHSR
jgi:meiosis-specific serine/threonine-protein kinase MEK1